MKRKILFACLFPFLCVGQLKAQDDNVLLQSVRGGKVVSAGVPDPKYSENVLTLPLQATAQNEGFTPETLEQSRWTYDPVTHTLQMEGMTTRTPLVTKDVYLPAGTYRIGWEYLAGRRVQGYWSTGEMGYLVYVDPYSVVMVQKGAEVSTGKELYSNDLACTDRELAYETRTFTVTEADTVYFAFVPTPRDLVLENTGDTTYFLGYCLGFKSLTVDAYVDNDMSLESMFSSLTHVSTVEQTNAEHEFRAIVWNKGKQANSAVVSVFDTENPSKVYGKSSTVGLNAGEQKEVDFTAAIEGVPAGYEGSLTVRVDVVGKEDGNPYDNAWEYSLALTDSTMTYDVLTDADLVDAESVVGQFGTDIWFGTLYDVKTVDTLTSFTVGWGPDGLYGLIQIAFYRWNEETDRQDYLMYETEAFYRKESDTGFSQVIPCRHLMLNPGRYFLELRQLSDKFAAVATDNTEGGVMYVSSTSSGVLNPQTQYGYAALRMNFGRSDAQVLARDYEVLSIDAPEASGQYAQNEEVKATIINNGVLDITDNSGWAFCEVDGQVQDSVQLNLRSYRREQVSFYVDLMAKGEHTVRVYVRLEDDENTGNDSFERVFISLGDPDPYVMDFEYCETGAASGFLPWTVRVLDTSSTIDLSGWEIPGESTKAGFIAIDPMRIDGFADEFPSRQGARYGLSIADFNPSRNTNCINDAWLISPRLQMPKTGSSISFLGMSIGSGRDEEYCNVLVSTQDSLTKSFKLVKTLQFPAFNPNGQSDPDYPWTRFTVDLSAYNGQEIFVAIQGQAQNYGLFLDDIRVSAPMESSFLPINDSVFPDSNFKEYVSRHLDRDRDGRLSMEEIAAVSELNVADLGITDLQGIEHFSKMIRLNCSRNRLTDLDLRKNVELVSLDCSGNYLSSLDLCQNSNMVEVVADSNYREVLVPSDRIFDLTTLPRFELSRMEQLQGGTLQGSLLTFEQDEVRYFYNYNCPNPASPLGGYFRLRAIVDSSVIQDTTVFIAIDEEHFPDAFFRNYIAENADMDADGQLSKDEITEVTGIDVSGMGIQDLRGVEYFTELESLDCSDNELTSLDLSKNTKLQLLNAEGNQLDIVLDEQNCFDLSTLPGFDLTKASDWTSCARIGNNLTFKQQEVTYTYATGYSGANADADLQSVIFSLMADRDPSVGNEVSDLQSQGRIYAKDHVICTEGIETEISIYSASGSLLYRGFDKEIPVRHDGLYLVRSGDRTWKVLVM